MTFCSTCKWFVESESQQEQDYGICKRYPPVRVNESWIRPVVYCQDICGEFSVNRSIIKEEYPTIKSEYSEEFDIFWKEYPRKIGKAAAWKAWKKNCPDLNKCLATLKWQRNQEQWQDEQFVPHPSTWLNQCRWDDEPINIEQPVKKVWHSVQ